MSVLHAAALVLVAGILVYLLVALLKPEKF
jgi:K+-transporting ATPase KdpF subunit